MAAARGLGPGRQAGPLTAEPADWVRSAYQAADGFADVLAEELARRGIEVRAWHGLLALSPDPPGPAAWALNVWTAPREMPVPSIGMAADSLRAIQRNWAICRSTITAAPP